MIQHEELLFDIIGVKFLEVQQHLLWQLKIATCRPEHRKLVSLTLTSL